MDQHCYNKTQISFCRNQPIPYIALALLFFRREQFVEVQAVKYLQFTPMPDINRGKINSCETLRTIRQRISR